MSVSEARASRHLQGRCSGIGIVTMDRLDVVRTPSAWCRWCTRCTWLSEQNGNGLSHLTHIHGRTATLQCAGPSS